MRLLSVTRLRVRSLRFLVPFLRLAFASAHGASPHREAMPRLAHWCDEASVSHRSDEAEEWDSWPGAASRLQQLGRLSRVNQPLTDQARGRIVIT